LRFGDSIRHYRLGNVEVASELVLPGLLELGRAQDVAITIRRGVPEGGPHRWVAHPEGADYVPAWTSITHLRSDDGRWYRIRYDYRGHVADFAIRSDGSEITVEKGEGETDGEVANLIEGPILGRAMRLAGRPCLHATALGNGARAIALMGASGVGKSSLAWALVRQGCRLITDDMVGFSVDAEGAMVQPGRARLRLWPDSAQRLGVAGADAVTLFPTAAEMEKIGVHDPAGFGTAPVRLQAIYKVLPRAAGLAEPEIVELPASQRLAELAANLHGMIVPGREGRKRELALLAGVAATVPLRALTLPDDLAALPEVTARLKHRLFE
jgi:hypothetical protein